MSIHAAVRQFRAGQLWRADGWHADAAIAVGADGRLREPADRDGDGIVVVPATRITEVVTVAQEIHEAEDHIRAAIEQGRSLRQARSDFGYHQLQTRR